MRKFIIANWKMNPKTEKAALRLFREEARIKPPRGIEVAICPPFVWLDVLSKVKGQRSKVLLGAQDAFWEEKGARTGEVSPDMLRDLGVRIVIIGHSERRALGETDAMVNKKVKETLKEGLRVILCVGEPLRIHRKGFAAAKKFVAAQLRSAFRGLSNVKGQLSHVVIAYEPIWAIGTGRPDSPAEAAVMAGFIKKVLHSQCSILNSPVLYGGSVTGKNAAAFLSHKEIGGALVGGASLHAKEFARIVKSATAAVASRNRFAGVSRRPTGRE